MFVKLRLNRNQWNENGLKLVQTVPLIDKYQHMYGELNMKLFQQNFEIFQFKFFPHFNLNLLQEKCDE